MHPTWEEGVKRSAETQTAVSPPKKTRLQRLIDPLQVILPTEEQQTQTPTRRDFDEIAFSDMALGLRDRPVWAASSTQTSPRVPDTSTSLIKGKKYKVALYLLHDPVLDGNVFCRLFTSIGWSFIAPRVRKFQSHGFNLNIHRRRDFVSSSS